MGCVLSVNVGRPRPFAAGQHQITTSFAKEPVTGRVRVRHINIDGDRQADLTVHGGPDKAVYAYASEDIDWWTRELGYELATAPFGENLTTGGVDLNDAVIGERWHIGTTVLQVAQPRTPCYKLGLRFGDRAMPRRFAAACRPGVYLRVLTEGDLAAGDEIVVTDRPDHGVTVALVAKAFHQDHSLATEILRATELPDGWRHWAMRLRRFQES